MSCPFHILSIVFCHLCPSHLISLVSFLSCLCLGEGNTVMGGSDHGILSQQLPPWSSVHFSAKTTSLIINQFLFMSFKNCLQDSFPLPYFHCLTQRSQAQNMSREGDMVTSRGSIRTNLPQGTWTWYSLCLEHSSHLPFMWLLTASPAPPWHSSEAFSECYQQPTMALTSLLNYQYVKPFYSFLGLLFMLFCFSCFDCFLGMPSTLDHNNFCLI